MSMYSDKTDYMEVQKDVEDTSPETQLTASELAQVQRRVNAELLQNEKYIRTHPELREMIQDFIVHAVEKQPSAEQLMSFTTNYFCHDKKQYKASPREQLTTPTSSSASFTQ